MTSDFKEKIFELYENEIQFRSFENNTILVEVLILYKELGKIDSYLFNGAPLSFVALNNDTELIDTPTNCIIFGGESRFCEDLIDEKATGFLNVKMQNQEEGNKFKVYLDYENRVVQITDSEASNGEILLSYISAFYVCAIITRLLPWYFSDIPVNDIKEYVLLFASKDACDRGVFEEKFEEFVERSGMRNEIFKTQLKKISDVASNRMKETATQKISETQSIIESKFIEIHRLNETLRECRAVLDSMTSESNEYSQPIEELMEFINNTPADSVRIIDIADNAEIKFEFNTKLEYYDEYESSIKNGTINSIMLGSGGSNYLSRYPINLLKQFYEELIEKNTISIHTTTTMKLDVLSGRVYAYDSQNKDHAIQHPHLSYFNCFGYDLPTLISELTLGNRYAEAMNQLLYCAKQVTLADGAAMDNLIRDMKRTECIECPDGAFRNFNETMTYLIEEGIINEERD